MAYIEWNEKYSVRVPSLDEQHKKLFEMINKFYATLAAQKTAHAAFTQKVNDVVKRLNDGKLVLSVEITAFLKNWLTEHILQSDGKYADCLVTGGAR
jgi:hemerythrin